MFFKKDVLLCEMNPLFFKLAVQKGIWQRKVQDQFSHLEFSKKQDQKKLPVCIYSKKTSMIKRAPGIDPQTQYNKAHNINMASSTLDGLIIQPGETFSFWRRIGNPIESRGYKKGRVIDKGKIIEEYGGGLCNLANTIHVAILHSPLTVTEFHHHSDALAPDHGKRVPFSAGTSVSYNYVDYRCTNNTNQAFQFCSWCEGEDHYFELRCEKPLDVEYKISEQDHHFEKIGEDYYRISKIFKDEYDKQSGELVNQTLVLDNKSKVMFDPGLIDKSLIR